MPDYQSMYHKLFNVTADAVKLCEKATEILKQAHRETEDMYIDAPDPEIHLLPTLAPPEDEQ